MVQLDNHSQLTQPQNTYQRFKRSIIRLFRRLGRKNVKQSNTLFQNAHDFNISGNPNFYNAGSITQIYGGGTDSLDKLEKFVSFAAQFDSSAQDPQRRCHQGTRQNVLKRLRDWSDNPRAQERIFWLYGPAGAGKSAIAQTIARLYTKQEVAATFFFFRSDINRNDGNRLFTTLAYQLALSMPAIRAYIANSIFERPDLPRAEVETQFDQLIARPFQDLRMDATQQLAPAVHVINRILKKYQELAPVIIIDGIDECTDENLQRQFLKVIGDAVKDDRIPLRFLIVSRQELHIEHTINRWKTPILRIDLARLDDASRDIEKYLVDEFSRIASEQDLDQAWPGQEVINNIVYKSSGNFIYASVVIRFVGDPYCFAKTQLEIVLNMKPPKTMSPFGILDQLFLEILERVPDQDFLKKYLVLLVSRMSVSSSFGDLYKDDAVLMHVSEEELHANLRRMRSLLKFKPGIDIHHRSFLDFLHDSSRSGQYHIGEKGGIRRYLQIFVDSLIRYVTTVIEQPDFHNTTHFAPKFRSMIKDYPPSIELPSDEWQEVIQPLLDLQDKLLQLLTFSPVRQLPPCEKCTTVQLVRELLHLGLHQGMFKGDYDDISVQSVMNVRKRKGVVALNAIKTAKMKGNDLDGLLLSLFSRLPETMENWTPDKQVIKLMKNILRFDSVETAKMVGFISDAQKLVDFLYYMLGRMNPKELRQVTLLALEIFARIPVLPLCPSLQQTRERLSHFWTDGCVSIQILSQTILASRYLDNRFIIPLLGVKGRSGDYAFVANAPRDALTMAAWRGLHPNFAHGVASRYTLQLAKAIQYLHSFNVTLDCRFDLNNVFLFPDDTKVRCMFSTSQLTLDMQSKEHFSLEGNIFSFGCLLYGLFSGVDTKPKSSSKERRRIVTSALDAPEYVSQLIQQCCTQDPKLRPTMNEIVREMENWK